MAKVLSYAMNLLAGRDYSEAEIRRKMAAYLPAVPDDDEPQNVALSRQEIEQAIAYCKQHGWLDDERYARRYIAGRVRKGYGVQRIRGELRQKGIEPSTLARALQACEVDWYQLAQYVAVQKFGSPLPAEWQVKVKVQRYLLYRGFSHDEIQSVYMNFSD